MVSMRSGLFLVFALLTLLNTISALAVLGVV